MTIEEALKILQINGTDVTKEEIYNSFRKLAKIYHPDKGGDSQKFIQIHKAYEFLNKNFINIGDSTNFEAYDSIDELNLRIIDVTKAFEKLHKRYQIEIDNLINNLYVGTFRIIDNYESKKELKMNLFSDVNDFLNEQIENFQLKLNNGIIEIINNYDNWLFNTFKDTYKFLKRKNLKYFYKSKFFYLILILNFLIFFLSLNYIYSYSFKTNLISLIFCFFLSPIIYFFYINSKYDFNKNIEFVNKNKIKVDFIYKDINAPNDKIEDLLFNFGKGFGILTGAGAGFAIGAAISSSLGLALGPLGILLGFSGGKVLGSFLDEILGKSLNQYKNEAKQKVASVIDDISRDLITSLNDQFPQVMQNLIQTMEENYKNNKAKTIKLLLNKN